MSDLPEQTVLAKVKSWLAIEHFERLRRFEEDMAFWEKAYLAALGSALVGNAKELADDAVKHRRDAQKALWEGKNHE